MRSGLRRRWPIARRCAWGVVCGLFVAGGLVIAPAPGHAAIVGIVPGSNNVAFTFSVGGIPVSGTAAVPLEAYPGVSAFGDGTAEAGFGELDVAYHFSPTAARVIIPDTGPVAIASQGAPIAGAGPVAIVADFSVSFLVDDEGVAATTIPISYPIAFGGSAEGLFVSFEAVIDYDSALSGYLGTSTLTFAHTFPGLGGSPFTIISGPDLELPALSPGDTLTLSGHFALLADGFPGASTEIEVFGVVPEPATWTMMVPALVLTGGLLRRRRARR